MNKSVLSLIAALPMLLCGAELWTAKNWTSVKADGSPNGAWAFDERGGSAKFTLGTDKDPAFVSLTLDNGKTSATLICREQVKFPKDSELTISGEYRTVDYVPGKKGQIWVNTAYNYQVKDQQKWQLFFLKPTNGEWRKFSNSKKIEAEATGSYRSYFAFSGESGTLEWRNLSLSVKTTADK